MSYRIKNTANDRSQYHKHRTAPRFHMEPSLDGKRLRLGESIDISDEHFKRLEDELRKWEKNGMVSITHLSESSVPTTDTVVVEKPPLDEQGLRLDGPTFEDWVSAGYSPHAYPPGGYAEKGTPGLTQFKNEQNTRNAIPQTAAPQGRPVTDVDPAVVVSGEQTALSQDPANTVEPPAAVSTPETPSPAATTEAKKTTPGKKKLV